MYMKWVLKRDMYITGTYVIFPQEKHNRLKRLKRLAEVEEAMCKSIGESTHLDVVLRSGAVPSDEELKNYREMVGRLEQTKVM